LQYVDEKLVLELSKIFCLDHEKVMEELCETNSYCIPKDANMIELNKQLQSKLSLDRNQVSQK
jgi:hypothetical protein